MPEFEIKDYLKGLYLKTVAAEVQEPLQCENLQPQVAVLRGKRDASWGRHFLGAELKGQHAICHISSTELITMGKKLPDSDPMPGVDEKYWKRRYNFFSRFDDGISMDTGAWFEVTPEGIARHIADRMSGCRRICDACAGVGGNAIQFALTPRTNVVCVDIDAQRLEKCKHNAGVYGVDALMNMRHGDFCEVEPSRVDAVFLSPPWGGPAHLESRYFSLKDVPGCDIVAMFARACTAWSRNVVFYLPRHVDLHELSVLAAHFGYHSFEVEKIYFVYPQRHLKLIVVYFGPMFASRSTFKRRRKLRSTPTPLSDLLSPLPIAGPIYRSIYACGILRRYLLRMIIGIEQVREEEICAVAKFVKVSNDEVRGGGVANIVSSLNQWESTKTVRDRLRKKALVT